MLFAWLPRRGTGSRAECCLPGQAAHGRMLIPLKGIQELRRPSDEVYDDT